jgi:cytoskeletal protein RodZ
MVRLGNLLHQHRLRKKLSLEEVARGTKIKERFLVAIERGDYHKLPSPAYAKGFVINYATYLGLPRAEVIALFRREFDEKRAYKVLPDSLTKHQTFPGRHIKIQESLLIIGLLVFLFVGFLLFQYRAAFIAPPLRITSPEASAIVGQEVTVSGKTDREASVTVNNEAVSINSHGEFVKRISLFPGKTTVIISAKNRFGKETVITREITVK